jgi:glycogen debranching enzyme
MHMIMSLNFLAKTLADSWKKQNYMSVEESILVVITKAVWCRDASYILRDMFLSGNVYDALKWITIIWSHQIARGKEKVVYGRGSPQMKFLPRIAGPEIEATFEGALPTTIYKSGFSEVYGTNPDIDSTALMISTTSWILLRFLNSYESSKDILPANDLASAKELQVDVARIVNFVVPCMLKAVGYLTRRDYDKDGLLEQSYNEDWMDTALRTGKIVYSQACWVLALEHLGALLDAIGKNEELQCILRLQQNSMESIEKELWSENAAFYVDLLAETDTNLRRVLTQDTLLYLVALTEMDVPIVSLTKIQAQNNPLNFQYVLTNWIRLGLGIEVTVRLTQREAGCGKIPCP